MTKPTKPPPKSLEAFAEDRARKRRRCYHDPNDADRPCTSGVYAIQGPNGVYVGEARCVFGRNIQIAALGLEWAVVQEMPGSSTKERRREETRVAEHLAGLGFAITSRNTTAHLSKVGQAAATFQRQKIRCPKGHAYDNTNTYQTRVGRTCRACGRDNKRNRYREERRIPLNAPIRTGRPRTFA